MMKNFNRWIILLIIGQVSAFSYNRPKLCPNATWNPNATTIADFSASGSQPFGIFINTNNTIYTTDNQQHLTVISSQGNDTLIKNITSTSTSIYGIFVQTSDEIYIARDNSIGQLDKLTLNSTIGIPIMYTCTRCWDIFIDINNNLYCSLDIYNQVISKSLNSVSNTLRVVAGIGSAGSAANQLNSANGIFVDTNFDLYVADCFNHRIQLFQPGQSNAITVAGNTSLNYTITLNRPTDVILDADGYLFIIEHYGNRLVGSGPNGFQCLTGCSGSPGSMSDQLNNPWSLSFDSYGNIFVTDQFNNRIQKLILMTSLCGGTSTTTTVQTITVTNATTISSNKTVSYNQPKLNPFAHWSADAITFANASIVGSIPCGIFVNTNNTVYVADYTHGQVEVWFNSNINPTQTVSGGILYPFSVFATINGDIYVDNGNNNGRVDKWATNSNTSVPVMYVNGACYGLFVDINDVLYCSMRTLNQVVTNALNTQANTTTTAAGMSCAGSSSNQLNGPTGIFVDTNLDLYVADSGNNRIQLFSSGQLDGITTVGNTSLNLTITLNYPTGVVLDADKYLFIVDSHNNRIVGSGPYGFRCLVGCSNRVGSTSNQLASPSGLSFDSYGNIFITDYSNSRIQKFILFNGTFVPSYNQPRLCPNASWNPNGTTLANSSIVGQFPYKIFINTNNTIYVANRQNGQIIVWSNETMAPTIAISGLSSPWSLFVTTADDIYVGNNVRVDKFALNSTIGITKLFTTQLCYDVFVDIDNTLYCSMTVLHQVIAVSLKSTSNVTTTVAGNGAAGSATNQLNSPCGTFVDRNFNLYVADCNNNRIQLFRSGQLSGTTIAGNTSLNYTISLNCPIGIIPDSDGYLFIADYRNNRIVGSGPNGFRCIVGCSTPRQLYLPTTLSFDSYGNLFVADYGNNRIQKFVLSANPCDDIATTTEIPKETSTMMMTTTEIREETSTIMMTTSSSRVSSPGCIPPRITLIPGTSSLLNPLQFRRNQDFFISSNIELDCNQSLSIIPRWTINNGTFPIAISSSIVTSSTELYIPARTLSYGIYQLNLTVSMAVSSSLTSTVSAYVQITASGITANLVLLGTSMITSGYQQDLILNPGEYSVDLDGYSFNASNWKYDYYCRIYGLYNFPNLQGLLLPIENSSMDRSNPSCLSNGATVKYNDIPWKSSLTILSGSLQPNRTYQFMVYLVNLQNSSLQATGYLLVQVENTFPKMIAIGCVISTMCVPNLEFQLVNPTTQVALFAQCLGDCATIRNITWNIYQGFMNSSFNFTKWILFNQINQYENIWFFGRNTSNFTATKELFLSNPLVTLWRFEVVYSFLSETSSSALNFIINQPPFNGSCSIDPLNGTTSTLFTISCLHWYDEDGIKDYSLDIITTNDPSQRLIIAFSILSIFEVHLPADTSLHLIISIRDTLNCIAEFNLSSIEVIPDSAGINELINNVQNGLTNNPIVQLLASGNQNTVGQIITSISQQFNQMNNQNIQNAVSSGIPATCISISPLGSERSQSQSLVPLNQSASIEFNKQLNSLANVRDYLMPYTTNLLTTTSNSIKLQATALAQLTQSTNQLPRTAALLAINKCYQLSLTLSSMATSISYEDVQIGATQLIQCAINVLSAVNGPLQQRTNILDLDLSRANIFPTDYDTDLESEWSNLNLFADGNDFSYETIQKNRNLYYQQQLANQISNQIDQIISTLTSALNIHLNIGQNSIINTSAVFMSLEISSNSNQTIARRSIIEPLASFGNSKIPSNTNLSTSISISILGNDLVNLTNPIEIFIPRDPNLILPSMIEQNVIDLPSHNQSFYFQYINITSILPISVHFEIHPLNLTLGYLFIYQFDQTPQLNQVDGWTFFCPENLTNESIYTYFIDNQQTVNHQSVIFGLRELNSTEMIDYCSNSSVEIVPMINQRFNFTSNYQLRIYTSGCYYLDSDNQWKSDGLLVGPLTNHYQTQCFSTYLAP